MDVSILIEFCWIRNFVLYSMKRFLLFIKSKSRNRRKCINSCEFSSEWKLKSTFSSEWKLKSSTRPISVDLFAYLGVFSFLSITRPEWTYRFSYIPTNCCTMKSPHFLITPSGLSDNRLTRSILLLNKMAFSLPLFCLLFVFESTELPNTSQYGYGLMTFPFTFPFTFCIPFGFWLITGPRQWTRIINFRK